MKNIGYIILALGASTFSINLSFGIFLMTIMKCQPVRYADLSRYIFSFSVPLLISLIIIFLGAYLIKK